MSVQRRPFDWRLQLRLDSAHATVAQQWCGRVVRQIRPTTRREHQEGSMGDRALTGGGTAGGASNPQICISVRQQTATPHMRKGTKKKQKTSDQPVQPASSPTVAFRWRNRTANMPGLTPSACGPARAKRARRRLDSHAHRLRPRGGPDCSAGFSLGLQIRACPGQATLQSHAGSGCQAFQYSQPLGTCASA